MKHPKTGDNVCCKLSYREFERGKNYTIIRIIETEDELNGVWFKNVLIGLEYPFTYNKYFYSVKESRKEKLKKLENGLHKRI